MPAPAVPYFLIEPNDVLSIQVTSVSSEAVAPFASSGTSFPVNNDGVVNLPVIGKVKLAGMNTEEAIEFLTDKVRGQLQKPIVLLSITNANVTILGEVNRPSRFPIEGPISLPHAIGVVGGFTKNARLGDVLVQRNEGGEIKKYHINLLNDNLFSSPCYYLQKGDVVDVQPLHIQ